MVDRAETKIYKTDGRHFLYLPKNLITDSQFPLEPGKKVTVLISKSVLVIQSEDEEDYEYIRIPRELYVKFDRLLEEVAAPYRNPEDYIIEHLREAVEKHEEWKRQQEEEGEAR